MSHPRKRRWILLVAVLVFAGFGALAFARAGTFLAVEDPLQRASALVVIGGNFPFRAIGAAELYREGWAPEMWLTQGSRRAAEIELERLDIDVTPEYVDNQTVLERLGVPPTAIRVVPGRNNNTATEVRRIAAFARQTGVTRVILVTSPAHSRRVRTLWHMLAGDDAPEAIVRHTRNEPFDAGRWWADAADAFTVLREWFGLLNAWAGFPIRSEHW